MASARQLTLETQRANDSDGFVLSAQPDKSQGRPVSKSGSQPIRQKDGLPVCVLPMPLVPVPATLITRPDSGGHRAHFHARSKTLTPTPEPARYCAGDVAGERGDRAAVVGILGGEGVVLRPDRRERPDRQ